VTGSMTWTLTATVPGGVAPGTVAHAVLSTHVDLEAFPCTPVLAGVPTVTCSGTTVGNALQGSLVVVVFAPGARVTGVVTGPGAPAVPPPGVGATAPAPVAGAAPGAAAVLPLLPPLPPVPPLPPLLPPPAPPFLLPPAPAPSAGAAAPAVPVIPEAESGALLGLALAALGALARWRGRRP